MQPTIPANRKRGRPPVGSLNIGVRIPPDQVVTLDSWIAAQPEPKPTRPEAIRRLVELGLAQGDAVVRAYKDALRSLLEDLRQHPEDENMRQWADECRSALEHLPSEGDLRRWFTGQVQERVELECRARVEKGP